MAKAGHRASWLALSLLIWIQLSPFSYAQAGDNPHFTIPLHAKVSNFEPCDGYLPVNCVDVRPTVDIEPGPVAIFVFVMNYTKLAGVQTAFEVDRSWTFSFGLWECQGLHEFPPQPPFGPTSGTISLAFTQCATSGRLVVIGRMFFVAATGCIGQVESAFPFGTHAFDCENQIDPISPGDEARLGKVCVGPGGRDACDRVVPVAPATWGHIKSTYR
jgi:hypothetical protein